MSNPPRDIASVKQAASKESDPHVGLFYVIAWKLYWEGVPATQADGAYFKSYHKTFYTYWKNTVTRNHPELAEYDFRLFPRGRVVFDLKKDSFVILADKCIVENPTLINKIASEMGLPEGKVIASVDNDCECGECKKAVRLAKTIADDVQQLFETTSDGRKVFFGVADRSYVVPSYREYQSLRRGVMYWWAFMLPVLSIMTELALETTDKVLAGFTPMLFIILYIIGYATWTKRRVRSWDQAVGIDNRAYMIKSEKDHEGFTKGTKHRLVFISAVAAIIGFGLNATDFIHSGWAISILLYALYLICIVLWIRRRVPDCEQMEEKRGSSAGA
jgi:hypothetical protein